MSRELDALQQEFCKPLVRSIKAAELVGIHMVPYETQRDIWRQAELWRQSRTTAKIEEMLNFLRTQGAEYLADVIESVGPQSGKWATNAIPGMSWHQWGVAADLYWDKNGDEPGGVEWNDLSGYENFARIATAHGLTSGYFWTSRDAVHVQLPKAHRPDMTIEEISDAMERLYGPATQE